MYFFLIIFRILGKILEKNKNKSDMNMKKENIQRIYLFMYDNRPTFQFFVKSSSGQCNNASSENYFKMKKKN